MVYLILIEYSVLRVANIQEAKYFFLYSEQFTKCKCYQKLTKYLHLIRRQKIQTSIFLLLFLQYAKKGVGQNILRNGYTYSDINY